jgi:uncharacterized iron-regulated protein
VLACCVTFMLLLVNVAATAAVDQSVLERTDHPYVGRVWMPASGREISPVTFFNRAASARYLLLGEIHDNPHHHVLQADLIEHVTRSGRRPLIVWEMIDSGREADLARCVHECTDLVAGLPIAVGWAASGWPDFAMYAPIAAVAARYGLSMAAANLTSAERLLITQPAGRALRHALGSDQPLPRSAARRLERMLKDSHCGMAVPPSRLEAMERVQRGRDRRMYQVLVGRATADGAVLIAGAGHTRRDFGIGRDFVTAGKGDEVLAIAFVEVTADCSSFERCVPGGREAPWDMVWLTARAVREDPCAALLKAQPSDQPGSGS